MILTNVRLGYACINTELRKKNIFMSRTCRLETIKTKGLDYVYSLVYQNLADLKTIIEWNFKNDIFVFRLSSEIFPFATHKDYFNTFDLNQFKVLLQEIGNLAVKYNQRLSFHPGHFTQLSSHRDSVVVNSIREIDFHAKILDLIECSKDSVIVLHGGTKQGGKDASLLRFKENYKKLSTSSRDRIVLENCETCYTIKDLIPISEELQIPIVIDLHHHAINSGNIKSDNHLLEIITSKIFKVWDNRSMKPKLHLSESRPGVKITDNITIRRAHADYITFIPNVIIELNKIITFDLMIEAKMKEDSLRLIKKFSL